LNGTYLYSESGFLNGRSYAESGREAYDGQGGIERATYSVSADCTGTAKYPDG
jgi:hypothetical protein